MNKQLDIQLRQTEVSDLEKLFLFQLDEEARFQAAFTSNDSLDKQAYLTKFTKLLGDPTINNKTIIVDNIIVGSISKFEINGEAEVTYWIDKSYWREGIASKALKIFLTTEMTRPIYGRTATDNIPSQKVLEKAGFVRVGSDIGFANARQKEIEEFIFKLG